MKGKCKPEEKQLKLLTLALSYLLSARNLSSHPRINSFNDSSYGVHMDTPGLFFRVKDPRPSCSSIR